LTLRGIPLRFDAVELELSALPDGQTEQDLSEPWEDVLPEGDTYRFDRPVRLQFMASKTQDEVVADGECDCHAVLTCVRCLDETAVEIRQPFRVVVHIVDDAQFEADTGDEDFYLVRRSDPVWNLGDLIRDLLLLSIPVKPLCRTDCAGICPECGANRNTDPCNCRAQRPEGPLADLGRLMEKAGGRQPDD
jgi:uncharacterized protein